MMKSYQPFDLVRLAIKMGFRFCRFLRVDISTSCINSTAPLFENEKLLSSSIYQVFAPFLRNELKFCLRFDLSMNGNLIISIGAFFHTNPLGILASPIYQNPRNQL
ncbi:unnamed protein product [Rhizophagus irregularis]|nr:unnamed protein product [Rhizophagus irregularis]